MFTIFVTISGPVSGDHYNLLPIEVGRLLDEEKCRVRVLEATDKWYGVTYKEDKEIVMDAFRKMKVEGKYPQKLWG